jgi:hypothetical protein
MVLTRNRKKGQKALDVSLGTLNILKNFPDDLLQNLASYLPKTLAALFATLFTHPNVS